MIVATAGHIDHGKTTLVKALTGVDTDRLPQEKKRGISIDLGFAYWSTPAGTTIGFVDVPGHERFVHNMLAGVCATDFVLLVVAADDGVMPQTREHLHIVDLLDIRRGLVVVTKADRVDAGRVREVADEARALIAGTALDGAEVLAVSAPTGQGLDVLRDALARAAAATRCESVAGRRFRFAVDRAFTVAGSGTVVTGAVFDGIVKTGDRLLLSPAAHPVRVRGIQKDDARAEQAVAGERCALNLAGIELAQVRRGDWVLDAQLHAPGTRVDVELRVLACEKQPLRHWTPVHIHLGTRSVTGRIAMRRSETVEPGGKGFARLVADQPLAALHGDRFILRDQSARRTLGGGVVLDAFPSPRRAPASAHEGQLQAHALAAPAESLQALVQCSPAGVVATEFARNRNLDTAGFARVLEQAGLVAIGVSAEAVVLTKEQAAARALRRVPPAVADNPEHTRLWQLAQPVLREAGRAGLTLPQLVDATRGKEAVLQDMLHQRIKSGDAVRVGDKRFYLRSTIDEFITVARNVAGDAPQGRFTAARFRDGAGVGRTLAIEVLEAMDRLGVTQRLADVRVMRGVATQPAATSLPAGTR